MGIKAPEVPRTLTPPGSLQLIADAHRWRVLQELTRSDRRVGELSALLDRPQNLVSYHVAQLREAGLVTARRSSADGRDTYYRIELRRFADVLATAGTSLHPALRQTVHLGAPSQAAARRRGRPVATVLFLCTGNSARSQIARALLEQRSGGAIAACSAGSHPKRLHPNAVRVLAERGIDISGRPTTHLGRFARRRFDHVITLCDKVREVCPEFPGQPTTAHWSMPDPSVSGETDDATYPSFVAAADEIEQRVDLLIAQITAVDNDTTHASPTSGSRREENQ
jgi:protein-tyrosine-phosphatase/DNA-binding HxlR family transcriptional regulator